VTPYADLAPPPPPRRPRETNPIVLLLILIGIGAALAFGGLVAFGIYQGVKQAGEETVVTPAPSASGPHRKARLPPVERAVPHHTLAILDGCTDDDVRLLATGIDGAISVGAPLYNEGNFSGCYHMYEGTAADVERKLSGGCVGAGSALEAGRKRAASLEDPSAQAWAMRDAFDGLLNVIAERESGH
jgi:serine protease Do